MGEWTVGAVFDAVADVVPDRLMSICGPRRSTFAESLDRTRRIANYLAAQGLGVQRERAELQPWECGQDRVALIMHNDLYPDVVIGCLKARTVPVNVNHNYTAKEVAELLSYVRPSAVIYHRGLGARFAEVLREMNLPVLVSIDDETHDAELPGAVVFEDALARGDHDLAVIASPDDLMMICTGGTTGRPKGVLWRQGDIYVSSMSGTDHDSVEEIRARVAAESAPWFALSPLMHAAGMWTAFNAILVGAPVVLYDNRRPFDARTALETAQREKVWMMSMVGDAYAGPLVGELRRGDYDLSTLALIGIGGAATNTKNQQALLEKLPQIVLSNGYGSSETGNMGFGHSHRDDRTNTFTLREGTALVSADYTRFLRPGEKEVGWVARSGRIPLGYFDDADATRKTFRHVEDRRVVIAGDLAELVADGTLRLHGRDSLVINSGGEKVFVEEVEEVVRAHPDVADALVVGRPSDRWGHEVTAIISLHQATSSPPDLREHCIEHLARFKVPKQFIVVDAIRRLGNGKADYRWAKTIAVRGNLAHTESLPG